MCDTLTELEKQLLNEIKEQDGNGEYILDSDFKSQYLSILKITIPHNQLRGILSSLSKKDYIEVYQEDGDSVIKIKENALQYYLINKI